MAAIVPVLQHKVCRRTHTRTLPPGSTKPPTRFGLLLFRENVGRTHTNTTRPRLKQRPKQNLPPPPRVSFGCRAKKIRHGGLWVAVPEHSRTVKTRPAYLFGALARMVTSVPRVISRSSRPCA